MAISILNALLALASAVATYLQQRQLLDAGAAQAIQNGRAEIDRSLERVRAARIAAIAAGLQPSKDEHDPYNRD
jgi:hypothetical protein